jgi:hypothetical protein
MHCGEFALTIASVCPCSCPLILPGITTMSSMNVAVFAGGFTTEASRVPQSASQTCPERPVSFANRFLRVVF